MQPIISIESQLNAIREATTRALQSKESAIKFLQAAGIMDKDKDKVSTIPSTSK